jgi:hypothetical protein
VHRRILLGVAAWLVGASAATGGSLLAVSLLGQDMAPSAGEQQSVATVNRALGNEAAERTSARPRRAASPPASRAAPPSQVARHTAPPRSPTASHSAPPTSAGIASGTVLTSQGGTLVASCVGARAYLVSWSPQQGFGSSDVVRGPAVNAQVVFVGGQLTVTMIVACHVGVPAAATTAVSAGADPAGAAGGDGE